MKSLILPTLAALLLTGCIVKPPSPEKKVAVSNPAYEIDQLFTDPNGCTIYRFYDQNDFRYYVVGPNGAHMMPTTKTVTETDTDIVTVDVDNGGGHGGGHGGGGGHQK